MLVLTRKLDEKIQIGSDITITIVRIKGHAVQIGIEAPQRTEILRGELAAAADLRAESLEGHVASTEAAQPTEKDRAAESNPQDLGCRAFRTPLFEETVPSGAGALLGFEVAFAW